LYVFAKSNTGQRSFHAALGMILAGALGNLYDRIFNGGEVRDFIKIELHIRDFELWPWIFNVADMLLVCGVSILMLNIWLSRKHPGTREGEQPAV
jgi:signal peptidase II